MTTTDFLGREIFKSGSTIAHILTYGLINGVDKMEQVIKTTYTKQDAETIINTINALK